MISIEFITGDTFTSHWCGGSAEYTPVYAILNGVKRLVTNIIHALEGDTLVWREYSDKRSVEIAERAKNNLMKHDGKYITFRALNDNPFEFLNWIKENGYTLEAVKEFFSESSDGDFTDFHGNFREYSCSFYYRIYDETMLKELKEIVTNMRQHIR